MTWIRVDTEHGTHPKIRKLGRLIHNEVMGDHPPDLAHAAARGWVTALWCWTMKMKVGEDGILPECSVEDIADAINSPECVVERMVDVGLLAARASDDRNVTRYTVNDWGDHQEKAAKFADDAKDKNRKRQQRYRDRQKGKEEASKNAEDSDVTLHNDNANASVTSRNALRVGKGTLRYDTKETNSTKSTTALKYVVQSAAFWEAYPRKAGKKAALKAYDRAITAILESDPGCDPHLKILSAVSIYAGKVSGEDPQYTAHPATWLNQGRWDDVIEESHADADAMKGVYDTSAR